MEINGQLHGPVRDVPTEGAPRTFLDFYKKEKKTYKPEGNRIIVSNRSTNEVIRCVLWS